MLVRFGLDFERYWRWQEHAVETGLLFYGVSLVALLVGGAIFGASQAVALRSHGLRVVPWIVATAVGLVLLAAVFWPLAAAAVLGVISGPVEPILFTVVGGSLAGVCQYQALRRQGIAASRWLVRWIVGVVGGPRAHCRLLHVCRRGRDQPGMAAGCLLQRFLGGRRGGARQWKHPIQRPFVRAAGAGA
jgi:hypothetical protein